MQDCSKVWVTSYSNLSPLPPPLAISFHFIISTIIRISRLVASSTIAWLRVLLLVDARLTDVSSDTPSYSSSFEYLSSNSANILKPKLLISTECTCYSVSLSLSLSLSLSVFFCLSLSLSLYFYEHHKGPITHRTCYHDFSSRVLPEIIHTCHTRPSSFVFYRGNKVD